MTQSLPTLANFPGREPAKARLREVIKVLSAGHNGPRRVLLSGLPGCGKLTLAEYAANEAGARCLYCMLPEYKPEELSALFAEVRTESGPVMFCIDDAIRSERAELQPTWDRLLLEAQDDSKPDLVVVLVEDDAANVPPSLRDCFDFHVLVADPVGEDWLLEFPKLCRT